MPVPGLNLKKVSVLGDMRSGKTALIRRFVHDDYSDHYTSTATVVVYRREVTLPETASAITLLLFDFPGRKGIPSLYSQMINSAAGVIVFDLMNGDTFSNIGFWVNLFRAETGGRVPVFLIGAKSDAEERIVSDSQIEVASRRFGAPHILTSAKLGRNVEDAFRMVSKAMPDTPVRI